MKYKILNGYDHICLFCGNEIESRYEDYYEYYECNCPDAIKNREISEHIRQLESERPTPKFMIVKKDVLYENKKI